MRITKVTTKIGDNGTTSLGDGTNISKSNLRIHCIGDVDELNSIIGNAKIVAPTEEIFGDLSNIQNDLLNIGGELSLPDENLELLKKVSITQLELKIDIMNKKLPPLKEFVLPGGDEFSARIHIARTVCRRVERGIVQLIEQQSGNNLWIKYLNRLSDYFFVLARHHNFSAKIVEEQWSGR